MFYLASHHVRLLMAVAVLAAVLAALAAPRAVAYTPDSPEVRAAVAKAVQYLESYAGTDDRMGGKALIGLAVLKAGASEGHPRIREAVAAIQKEVRPSASGSSLWYERLYTPAIALIFLIELDSKEYAGEIKTLLGYLGRSQKANGAWGYPASHIHGKTSDTSMTQYGALALWEAHNAGFEISASMVEDVLIWLLKTQDPSGGFGYQGTISPTYEPVEQQGVTLSLTAAGLGSVYCCDQLLGLSRGPEKAGTLPALVALGKPTVLVSRRVDRGVVAQVQARGNQWMARNFDVKQPQWTHYYLYALERYQSMREACEGRSEEEPAWYNQGAEFLMSTQSSAGSWPSDYHSGLAAEPITTSFGILFLVRSMKKSIERARNFGSGSLVGGRGLPKDTDAVIVRDGTVTSLPEAEAVEQVLAAVGEGSDPEQYEQIAALASMSSEDATPLIDKHAEKLRRLIGDASPEARRAAVAALAKRRNMDDVPVLIYALTDPDPAIVLEARDGLRRISRKFHGFGLPDEFSDAERRTAVEQWKLWYLEVRPDAEFMQ